MLWEEFKLPIWVTEFDWNANNDVEMGDHTVHAEQIHNFYTLMFSLEVSFQGVLVSKNLSSYLYIKAVHGILMWNLNIVDEATSEPNKAGQEYLRLTK